MKATKVYENLGDILKPKKEESIINDLKKLDKNSLYNLWVNSFNEDEFNEKITLLLLQINENVFDSEELISIIEKYPELKYKIADKMINMISENYDRFKVSKSNGKIKIMVDDLSEFAYMFLSDQRNIIDKILRGISNNDFYLDYELIDLNLYVNVFKKHSNKIDKDTLNYFKDLLIEKLNKYDISYDQSIKNMDFGELFEWIIKNTNESDLPLIYEILQMSIAKTQEIADEAAAYNHIKNQILEFFKADKFYHKNNEIYLYTNYDKFIHFFKAYYEYDYEIDPKIPYNGFNGNFENHIDDYDEELLNIMYNHDVA